MFHVKHAEDAEGDGEGATVVDSVGEESEECMATALPESAAG